MALSEKELFINKTQDQIHSITNEITDNIHSSKPNNVFIIKKMNEIIHLINKIENWDNTKKTNRPKLIELTSYLIILLSNNQLSKNYIAALDLWCTSVNQIKFEYAKNKVTIKMPDIKLDKIFENILKISFK